METQDEKSQTHIPNDTPTLDVVIIGTGFSGLGMAIGLKRKQRDNFIVLEKAASVGGTWRDNVYPGCACDVPSHLYCYSFAPNPHWTRVFAPQEEIRQYLEDCTDTYRVRPHIRFNTQVHQARFDDAAGLWQVETTDGQRYRCRVLVSGQGALHIPSVPDIPGVQDFAGEIFHSAAWSPAADLEGRKVAIIGTGASAIQIVPNIADAVNAMVVFQRTPAWIQPKPDWKLGRLVQLYLKYMPLAKEMNRWFIYWMLETRVLSMLRNKRWSINELIARWHLRRQVRDKALRDKLRPDYRFGCKRVLLSNDYYPALARGNIHLETSPVARITGTSIVTQDNTTHEVDTIIFATGFAVTDVSANPMQIYGRNGQSMREAAAETVRAYLGISVEGFPNFFTLMGPHTGLGHNSMIYMIESQILHILSALDEMDKQDAATIEVTADAQNAFEDEMDRKMAGTVWMSGCKSWYQDKSGRIATIWPDYTFRYRLRTRKIVEKAYKFNKTGEHL